VDAQRVNDHEVKKVNGRHQVGWSSPLETNCLSHEHGKEAVQREVE
jgi:hypothetical protein